MQVVDKIDTNSISIPSGNIRLDGDLEIPGGATGLVLFAHGSGSSRKSPRNRFVARKFQERHLGTLLFDLLTPEEESVDMYTRHLKFDIGLLGKRLVDAVKWTAQNEKTRDLKIGLFGASTGAAAALVAAAELGDRVSAVVSRGGRPDLAGECLPMVKAPVLLIIGGLDEIVIDLNKLAFHQLECEKELRIVPGATHLFEEPGALERVAEMASGWFKEHLVSVRAFGQRS
jgi:dienelactone hydrolase